MEGLPRPTLELRTMGSLEIRRDNGGDAATLLTQSKRVALLVYLALAEPRGLHRRDAILPLFWPELDQQHARAALRQSIYHLRQTLSAEVILTEGVERVGLGFEHIWCDVIAFEKAFAAGEFESALQLYRGDLLIGFHVPDTESEWEDWLSARRNSLREKAIQAAGQLSAQAVKAGLVGRGADWARKALALAPGDEAALGRLLLLLAQLGDQAGAARAYEEFAARRIREVGVEPSERMKALVLRIRSDAAPVPEAHEPWPGQTVSAEELGATATAVNLASPVPAPERKRPIGAGAAFAGGVAVILLLAWVASATLDFGLQTASGSSDGASPTPVVEPVLGGLHDTRIAFSSARDGNLEIYVVNGDGTELRRLTYDPADDTGPAWSPDGRWLVFASMRDTVWEIYRMRADGSELTRLTHHKNTDYTPAFSRDGKQIVWSRYDGTLGHLWIMNADGSDQHPLTNAPASDEEPEFSPDGRSLVFTSWRDAGGNIRNSEIYVAPIDGTVPARRLTASPDWDSRPDWSPDGAKVVFMTAREGLTNWEIFVMDADGSDQRNLTRHRGMDNAPRWSPDGSRIVFVSDRDGPSELYTMKPDGSEVRRLMQSGAGPVAWGHGPRAAGACLVSNGSFEKVEARRSNPGSTEFFGVPGWWPSLELYFFTGEPNSPDIFVAPRDVPRNFAGYQFPADGRNYAGFALGGAQRGATEGLAGTLTAPLVPGRSYEVRASFSVWDLRPHRIQVQVVLLDRRNGGILVVGEADVVNDLLWESFVRQITIPPDPTHRYDAIGFRSPPESEQFVGGLFVDDVDVCPVPH